MSKMNIEEAVETIIEHARELVETNEEGALKVHPYSVIAGISRASIRKALRVVDSASAESKMGE